MKKGSHFNGQPKYGQLFSWFDKHAMLKFSHEKLWTFLEELEKDEAKMLEESKGCFYWTHINLTKGGLFFSKIIRNACLWVLRIGLLCYFEF